MKAYRRRVVSPLVEKASFYELHLAWRRFGVHVAFGRRAARFGYGRGPWISVEFWS